jgi:hypothetical protein
LVRKLQSVDGGQRDATGSAAVMIDGLQAAAAVDLPGVAISRWSLIPDPQEVAVASVMDDMERGGGETEKPAPDQGAGVDVQLG